MDENLQSLKDWHNLLTEGVITEEEYNSKKLELLSVSTPIVTEVESISDKTLYKEKTSNNSSELHPDDSFSPIFKKRMKIFFKILGILGVSILAIGFWAWNNKASLLFNEFTPVLIDFYEREKDLAGSYLIKDSKYIDSFYSKTTENQNGNVEIQIFAKYRDYPSSDLSEIDNQLNSCIASYVLDNSKDIAFLDLNSEGATGAVVTGDFDDCSGGSSSESKFFLTLIDGKVVDVLIVPAFDFVINGNEGTIIGADKSTDVEMKYYFNNVTYKWERN